MNLKLERLQLRELRIPLRWPFETSFGRTTTRRIILTKIYDGSGAIGYGECTAGEEPFFNHETTDTAWLVVTKYGAPLLSAASISSASEASPALARIKGNLMARASLEAAVWDLESKMAGQPLWRYLGGTLDEIKCGVSIGLQKTIPELLEKVSTEVAAGYQRIKIKIKPGRDIELVAAIRERFPEITLSVDANSAYSLADIDIMKQLDRFKLLMIEQPLAAGDLVDHSKLQAKLETPICLDESIESVDDARHAIDLGSCRIVNIKLGRVGGHLAAKRIQDYALGRGIPVWCGGMLESGIGRAHNIAMSTLPGFSLPGDVSASSRYWEEDIIDPPVTVSPAGTIAPPDMPGIGYAVKEERIEALTVRREEMKL
ncbi:MAG TPA: o-succinylbenzoate synthase [Blastocatellia bacterium]